ncbi:MAG: hypothetical protein KAX04_02700 [Methanomicrobia archaeon]|nr:hypothetical protein [Methanomicrobia archaeon]
MAIGALSFAGLALTTVIIVFVVTLIIESLFVWFGAKVAGVDERRRTWGNAILAVILMLILSFILGFAGGTTGFVLGIIGAIAIIKYIYTTSWGKAIIAWVFMVIAVIIVGVVLGIGVLGLAFLG